MKRPEKKLFVDDVKIDDLEKLHAANKGFNHACEEWEAYHEYVLEDLITESHIILTSSIHTEKLTKDQIDGLIRQFKKAISKRLRVINVIETKESIPFDELMEDY